jgi:hypothetical protein
MNTVSAPSVDRPCAPLPRALPAWAYNHPEMTRLEYERILQAELADRLPHQLHPEAGRLHTRSIWARQRRRRAQRRRARFRRSTTSAAIAAHAARRRRQLPATSPAPITAGPTGCRANWSACPRARAFPGLDRAQFSAEAGALQIMLGFVFVCVAGNPPPLEQIWGRFRGVRAASLRGHGAAGRRPYVEHWDCDWKIAMDNYLESYHVPIGHPGLNRMFTPGLRRSGQPAHGVARGISWMRERESSRSGASACISAGRRGQQDLPEAHRKRWSFYSMLPNLGIDVFPDQMDFFQVLPRGPGKCTIRGASFALPDERREMRIVRYLSTPHQPPGAARR